MGKPNRPPIRSPSRRSARDGSDPAKRLSDGRFPHVPFPSPNPIFASEDPARPRTRGLVEDRPVEREPRPGALLPAGAHCLGRRTLGTAYVRSNRTDRIRPRSTEK